MASNESNVAVKHLRGELSKHFHFCFKLTANGKEDICRVSMQADQLKTTVYVIINQN